MELQYIVIYKYAIYRSSADEFNKTEFQNLATMQQLLDSVIGTPNRELIVRHKQLECE